MTTTTIEVRFNVVYIEIHPNRYTVIRARSRTRYRLAAQDAMLLIIIAKRVMQMTGCSVIAQAVSIVPSELRRSTRERG